MLATLPSLMQEYIKLPRLEFKEQCAKLYIEMWSFNPLFPQASSHTTQMPIETYAPRLCVCVSLVWDTLTHHYYHLNPVPSGQCSAKYEEPHGEKEGHTPSLQLLIQATQNCNSAMLFHCGQNFQSLSCFIPFFSPPLLL